jgi:hypothetical protein
MEVDFSNLVEAIARRVVDLIKEEGGTIAADETEAAPAPDKAPAKAPGKKAPAKAAPAKVKREDVLAKVREYGAKEGKDKAKGLVSKYAEAFGDVADTDLPKLLADVTAALAGEAPAAEDEGDGY